MMKFVLVTILIALSGMLHAATYYVRTDGSNSNNGLTNSSSGAWKTISYGLTQLIPGDTLLVQNGIYNEGGLSVPSGNSANWITVKGDGNPVINAGTENGFSHDDNSYIIIDGFTIQGYSNAGYYQEGICSYVHIINNIFNGGSRSVFLSGLGYAQDILIKDNDCFGQMAGDLCGSIDVGTSSAESFQNITIDGNNVHDLLNNTLGIQFDGKNSVIRNNTIVGPAHFGITIAWRSEAYGGGNRNISIINNTVRNCERGIRSDYNNYNIEIGHNQVFDSGGQVQGLDLYPWNASPTPPSPYHYWIHDNLMDNSGMGLYSNSHDIIENNTFRNGDAGIFFWDGSGTAEGGHIIRNNTFIGTPISLRINGGNITITGNKFYDKLPYGFNGFAFICWQGSSSTNGLYIVNNSFYDTNGMNAIESDPGASVISPVIVKNNIFHTVASALSDDSNKFGNLSITYNNVYLNSASPYGGKPHSNTLTQDPLFTDLVTYDFHLKSQYGRWNGSGWVLDDTTSPCIDAGDPLDDYSNEPMPNGGRINMGVYGNTVEASKSAGTTGEIEEQQLMTEFALHQNYPNPFNPETNITFDLPKNSFVSLKIFNLIGQEVAVLVNEQLPSGTHNYKVGSEQFELASGVYFYKLSSGEFVQTRKMLMLK